MKKGLLVCIILSAISSSYCQDFTLYRMKMLVQDTDSLPYRLLLPENYDSSKQYPLLFMLHGSGERGSDNLLPLTHGGDLFVRPDIRRKFPAIVVFPQCASNSFWSNVLMLSGEGGKRSFSFLEHGHPTRSMLLLEELVYYMINNYPVNKSQVYAGGLSMGGMGTFELVQRNPGIFAAAFSICGGANPAIAKDIKKVKWWIFHGAKDDVVDPAFSEKIVLALKREHAVVRYTLYPDANHNSWDASFAEPDLLPWLFAQHK